jgi:hypothetical protein
MHVHGASYSQFAAPIPAQSVQQAMAARRAAAEVRRKLSRVALAAGADGVSRVDSYTPGDGRRRDPQHDPDAFRKVFVSIKI